MPHERATVSVEEAARYLGISRTLAYEAARRGELPCCRVGNRILVVKARLEKMLAGPADQQADQCGSEDANQGEARPATTVPNES